jgi:translocation and assembly module TamA
MVEGIDGPILESVLASLSLEQQKAHPRLSEGRIRLLHQRAPGEIRTALQAFGYYWADVQAEL